MTPAALRGAEILLDFIGGVETGRTGADAYRTVYGHKEGTLPKPLTDFTIDELLASQLRWGKNWGSSAAGKFQIIRKTLQGLVKKLDLSGSSKFGQKTQDMLGMQLLLARGYEKFAEGRMSLEAFALELAKEWASMPVLADTQGANRKVKAGQSYYAGDGLNKALVTPTQLRAVLAQVLEAIDEPAVAPVPAPPVEDYEEPLAPPPGRTFALPGWLPLVVIATLSVIVGAVVWLGQGMGAEEVSLIGGVRMPMDRPAALFGGGGSLAGEIGLQVALAFVAPLVSAAATAVVGWIVYWWQRVLKADFDAKSADSLHKALERGMLAAIDAFGSRAGKAKLLNFAADYAATNNPGAVRHFKLSEEKLQQLAIPHLVAARR